MITPHRLVIADYVRILVTQGPDSPHSDAFFDAHWANEQFLELAASARLLYLALHQPQKRTGANQKKWESLSLVGFEEYLRLQISEGNKKLHLAVLTEYATGIIFTTSNGKDQDCFWKVEGNRVLPYQPPPRKIPRQLSLV